MLLVLRKDLNTLFDIVVLSDLWARYKVTLGWPTEEPQRYLQIQAPSPIVMEKYNQVINFMKEKVPQKEVDWLKINRTTQEAKQCFYDYYERLMQGFRQYSGMKNPERRDLSNFVFHFVLGLRPELRMHIQQNVICWQ